LLSADKHLPGITGAYVASPDRVATRLEYAADSAVIRTTPPPLDAFVLPFPEQIAAKLVLTFDTVPPTAKTSVASETSSLLSHPLSFRSPLPTSPSTLPSSVSSNSSLLRPHSASRGHHTPTPRSSSISVSSSSSPSSSSPPIPVLAASTSYPTSFPQSAPRVRPEGVPPDARRNVAA
jgi:hypothetical protein